MTHTNVPDRSEDVVGRLDDPDPFQLARRLKQKVRCCSHSGCGAEADIRYLWIDLSTVCQGASGASSLGVEDWLGVVDEAASLGATWIVFSFTESPSRFPEIWSICHWAQTNYDMMTGFHTRSGLLLPEDHEAFAQLDLSRCLLFVADEHLAAVAPLQRRGMRVLPAHPGGHDRNSICDMPSKMIFVDPAGVLHTCGMVKQNQDYVLGHILEKKLTQVLHDPTLPHAVPEQAVHDAHGCDGCPPLVAHLHKA